MSSRLAVALAAASFVVLAPGASAAPRGVQPSAPAAGDPIPGEVLVGFDRTASGSERAGARRAAGVTVERALRIPGVQLVNVGRGESTRAAIARLERDPSVRYAEPNRRRFASATIPNDPLFGALWGLQNSGQPVDGFAGTPDADIDAPEAWDVFTGGDALVAVVDEGVAYDHPELAPNMWRNPREVAGNGADDDGNGFIDDVFGADTIDRDGDPRDFGGHGTHVAGTIAAAGNDGIGVTGVSWKAQLMAVRALGPSGGSDATVGEAFEYAASHGARVVNASLGGPGASATLHQPIIAHPETLFVVAAGNDGDTIDPVTSASEFPCAFGDDNVICVAATDQNDLIAGFSNRGTTSVDLAAPGVNVLSTQPDRDTPVFSDGFETNDFAAVWEPHVDQGTTSAWARTSASAASGGFSMADSPAGNYASNSRSYADIRNAVNLTGRQGCQVTFRARHDLAAGDNLTLDRTLNNGADGWPRVFSVSGTTNGAYETYTADLDADGAATVKIGFGIETNATGTADGINVDDVSIRCIGPETGPGAYGFNSGTSMATPHVAGAAALLLSRKPSLTVAQVRSLLLTTGDPLSSLAGTTVTGRRLNADNAIRSPLSVPDPVATTAAASAIGPTAATLNGTVDPRTAPTSWLFEYGTTTAYGSATPLVDAGAGNGAAAVSAAVGGLTASTTYHYRLVAVRGANRFPGADATFATTAAPAVIVKPRPLTLKQRAKRARVSCVRVKRAYRCRVTRAGKLRVKLTLKRGRKVVGRGSGRAGKRITLRGPKAKKGRYKMTVTLRKNGKSASSVKRIRIR